MAPHRLHRPRREHIRSRLPRAGRVAGTTAGGGFFVQNLGQAPHYRRDPDALWGGHLSIWVLLLGIVIAIATVAIAKLVAVTIPWVRRRFTRRRRQLRLLRSAAGAEERSRALMDELCPHGWRAQLTLFGPGDELPADAPEGARSRVALDWAELEDERRRVAVVRRVWAATVAEALDSMVADRRTDETLEQIEQSAAIDGTLWPDF